jgi:hypothetical protein
MQTKPIFIGFAAAILILVIAGAAFFAGLYLGQRGYVADLQYQLPQNVQGQPPAGGLPAGNSPQAGPQAGQPAPGGVAPAGGPPGAPYWPSDAMGRLVSLTATEITLDSPQGIVTVALKADTKFIDEAGNPISASEIQPGNVAAVFGRDAVMIVMRLPQRP